MTNPPMGVAYVLGQQRTVVRPVLYIYVEFPR